MLGVEINFTLSATDILQRPSLPDEPRSSLRQLITAAVQQETVNWRYLPPDSSVMPMRTLCFVIADQRWLSGRDLMVFTLSDVAEPFAFARRHW